MSTYGRLWEERVQIRGDLRRHLPTLDPYATLVEATAVAATLKTTSGVPVDVSVLLGRWAEVERQMDRCDSETGEPR